METYNAVKTAVVTVISIWSKIDGLEGLLARRDKNVGYPVEVPVGTAVDDTLENAYMATNCDNRPMGRTACATTAGDILVLDNRHYLVEGHGFKELTLAESEKIQTLTSRDTSGGYAYLVKAGLV